MPTRQPTLSPLQFHLNLDIRNSTTKVLEILTASNFSDPVDTTVLLFSVLQTIPPQTCRATVLRQSKRTCTASQASSIGKTRTNSYELLRIRESWPVAHSVFPLQPHCWLRMPLALRRPVNTWSAELKHGAISHFVIYKVLMCHFTLHKISNHHN